MYNLLSVAIYFSSSCIYLLLKNILLHNCRLDYMGTEFIISVVSVQIAT